MHRIERIELIEIALNLKEPFRISSGEVQRRRILLVRLEDTDGVHGWGECVAGESPNYSPETVDTAWLAITEWIAPRLLEAAFEHPRQIAPLLEEGIRGHRMAKASVEMAVWELEARRQGISLAALLGGEQQSIPVGISIGIQRSPARLAERVGRSLGAGYRKIKIKIEPGADLDYLDAARQVAPSRILAADANSAYTVEETGRLRRLDNLRLMMIEQPFSQRDLLRHARLQRQLKTPLCLDESVDSLERLEDMLALGAGKILNLKPGRVGGFGESLAIHALCRSRGVPLWCGGMLESGIGRGHNVALASLPGFTLPGDISPSRRYWERDIVEPEWKMDTDGFVAVPFERPGIGVRVDEERIAALAVRRKVLGRKKVRQ